MRPPFLLEDEGWMKLVLHKVLFIHLQSLALVHLMFSCVTTVHTLDFD